MSFNIDKMISPFIKALPPSGLAKFLEITANNPNIVPLSVGEPDFDIPAKVREACIDSLNAGKSNYGIISHGVKIHTQNDHPMSACGEG